MKRFLLTLILVLGSTDLFAAWPYDSICEIMVPVRNSKFYSGGSATLIGVSDTEALLLTCQHVAERVGSEVEINWVSTGEQSKGKVIAVAPNGLDAAIVRCPRPKGLRPVPVTLIDTCKHQFIVNAGYPGVRGSLQWQKGEITYLDSTDLQYTCRPIPGMSGGATLDKYGNLVGVIQYYNRYGGGSTSGTKLMSFISRTRKTSEAKFYGATIETKELIEDLPEKAKTCAPEEWNTFQLYCLLVHGKEPIEPIELLPPAPTVEDEEAAELQFDLRLGPSREITITDDNPKITRPRRAQKTPKPRRRRFFQRRR